MAFSNWQLNRLRNALAAYHAYRVPEEDEDAEKEDRKGKRKRVHNWKDVAEAIAVASGLEDRFFSDNLDLDREAKQKLVKQYAERLRQFVEGYTDADGKLKYTVPKNVEAIVTFATDPLYDLLTKEELETFRPDWQAPLRLLEYLDHKLDAQRLPPPDSLEGTYEGERTTERALVLSELTLQRASKEGLIQVVQTDDFFEPSVIAVRSMSAKQREKVRRGPRRKYGGWAILTPEDTLMVFMKEENYHRNHYYFVLGTDLSRATEAPVKFLSCLYHDYTLETPEGSLLEANMPSQAMVILLENNIINFERVGHAHS